MKNFTKYIMVGLLLLLISMPTAITAKGITWGEGKSSIDFIDDASMSLEKKVKKPEFKSLKKMYKPLFFTPVWVNEKGLTHFGNELLNIIKNDKTLLPAMKSVKLLKEVQEKLSALTEAKGGTLEEKVSLELDFSNLFKAYTEYMLYGGIDWKAFKSKLVSLKKSSDIEAGWEVYVPKRTVSSILEKAVSKGSVKAGLKEAEPKRFKYAKLKKYLLKYLKMQKNSSWKKLPKFSKKITLKSSTKAIPSIRHNLNLEGDLGSCRGDMNSLVYDKCLYKAVKRFQLRNGLKPDGVIGKGTYAVLGMPVSKKISLIRLNLDRIKRLRQKEGKVRIELNIPSFRLSFYDGQKVVDTIRVVVGKRNHPTPSFGDIMQYIVVNPWWKIPESIVKKEMLRHLIKDPYYYERRGKVLHATWSEDSERIDPGYVNWASYTGKNAHIPYRFMQVPSRSNALGKIKFIFPNKYSVYLHDTPSKSLFFRTDRAFSHGCMRIQKPRAMLKALAKFNDNIDVSAIMKRLEGTEKKTIGLKTRVPVDITYLTAFVDDYGNINFRKDVYKYDKYTYKSYKYQVDKYKSKDEVAKKQKNNKKKSSNKKDADGYQISEVYPKG